MADRVKKSIINAKVNLLFYFLGLFFAFLSRKVFLDYLGDEFVGLTGTLGSILGYLNLAEFGVGSSISYFLYKPLQSKDKEKIEEILSLFGYLYRWIGIIILGAGIIISCFFPIIFNDENISFPLVYFAFYSFLCSSLIGYFINYRQIILSADQKNYLISLYFHSAGFVKVGLQILLAYIYGNPFVWITIELMFGVIGCILLNWRIKKEYPWLRTNKSAGRQLIKKYPEVIKNTKRVFIHQLKNFFLGKSDELFVFMFASLNMVVYYINYTMIIDKVSVIYKSAFDGVAAGIGNLVAEGEKENILKVFWEMNTIRHFVAGFICYSVYLLIHPFISLWLGPEYILDNTILIILLVYTYITISRGVIDMFNHAYGLYADVWSAWTELILNISITFTIGYYYGIIGIVVGKLFSVFFISVFWKPYYLYHSGFHLSVSKYWNGAIRNYLISILSFFSAFIICNQFSINPYKSFIDWIIYALIVIPVYLIINLSALYFFAKGAKDFCYRVKPTLVRIINLFRK